MTAPADHYCYRCGRPIPNESDRVTIPTPTGLCWGYCRSEIVPEIDWRARCLAAEAEALASRALLREVEPTTYLAQRIREHLRGRP